MILGLLFILFNLKLQVLAQPVGVSQSNDWLVNPSCSPSRVYEQNVTFTPQYSSKSLTFPTLHLENDLLHRTFLLSPCFTTIEYERKITKGRTFPFIRTLSPEGNFTLNNTFSFNIGGCAGIPFGHADLFNLEIYGSLLFNNDNNTFVYRSYSVSNPTAPFPYTPGQYGSPLDVSWPPKGIHLTVYMDPPPNEGLLSLNGLVVELHYEIYDCAPVLKKWIEISYNPPVSSLGSDKSLLVSSLNYEILRSPNFAPEHLSIFKDDPGNPFPLDQQLNYKNLETGIISRGDRFWFSDDDYDACCDNELHVSYTYYTLLIVGYGYNYMYGDVTGPGALLSANSRFVSLPVRCVLHDSLDWERQGLTIRRFAALLAPQQNVNPMHMMITDISSDEKFKTVIDQASEVGLEMLIIGFGANGYCGLCDQQILNQTWVAWFKSNIDYARSKNIAITAYTLMQLNGWGESVPSSERILSKDGLSRGDIACFATDFHQTYRNNVLQFVKQVGLAGLETDGQYENGFCSDSTGDHHHNGAFGSYDQQIKAALNFNSQLKSLINPITGGNAFQSGADYYVFSGANRLNHADSDAGYRLSNFWESITMGRAYSYDSTSSRLASSGMYCLNDINDDANQCGTERLHCIDFAIGAYMSSGTWPYLRRSTVYDPADKDGPAISAIHQAWNNFWAKYRELLIGDFFHLARPTGRSVEITLHSINLNRQSFLKGKGNNGKESNQLNESGPFAIISFINPLNQTVDLTTPVSLYYSNIQVGQRVQVDEYISPTLQLLCDPSYLEKNINKYISMDQIKESDYSPLTCTKNKPSPSISHQVGSEGYGLYDISIETSMAPRSYRIFIVSTVAMN